MSAHLLVMYPLPVNVSEFDRLYRERHLPSARSNLRGATGVMAQRVFGPGAQPFHMISAVRFPTPEDLLVCVLSRAGQEALADAAAISTGGAPTIIAVVDA